MASQTILRISRVRRIDPHSEPEADQKQEVTQIQQGSDLCKPPQLPLRAEIVAYPVKLLLSPAKSQMFVTSRHSL